MKQVKGTAWIILSTQMFNRDNAETSMEIFTAFVTPVCCGH